MFSATAAASDAATAPARGRTETDTEAAVAFEWIELASSAVTWTSVPASTPLPWLTSVFDDERRRDAVEVVRRGRGAGGDRAAEADARADRDADADGVDGDRRLRVDRDGERRPGGDLRASIVALDRVGEVVRGDGDADRDADARAADGDRHRHRDHLRRDAAAVGRLHVDRAGPR